MKKGSDLPTWMSHDTGMGHNFELCYDSSVSAIANGISNGRTKADLGEGDMGVEKKMRVKYSRCRQEYIRVLKVRVERGVLGGDVIESYDSFLKLCMFNLDKDHECYFDDPQHLQNDPEYVPSLIECLPTVGRMRESVGAGLKRMEGLARGIAVLVDKGNESNLGLPDKYVGIGAEVLNRINGKVLRDQTAYFISEIKRCLVSSQCMCLDGACRR